MRAFGSFGRIYLGGEERDIDVGYRAAEQALEVFVQRAGETGRDDDAVVEHGQARGFDRRLGLAILSVLGALAEALAFDPDAQHHLQLGDLRQLRAAQLHLAGALQGGVGVVEEDAHALGEAQLDASAEGGGGAFGAVEPTFERMPGRGVVERFRVVAEADDFGVQDVGLANASHGRSGRVNALGIVARHSAKLIVDAD